MGNVILIQSLFALIYLIVKRGLLVFYKYEKAAFDKIKNEYYWLEYLFIFTATIVTPQHTYNEGLITLFSVIVIKIIIDNVKEIDHIFERMFHKDK